MSKTINGTTTQFVYDGLNPLQELNGASPPVATANMLTGLGIDEYFQRSSSNGTFSYLTDMLGSTLALADSGGNLNTTYTYEPFGNTTISGSSGNPYQFTGRENDATGLYYYRARYYSPTFQRFIAQDPIGFAGGDANLYAYVIDVPTALFDPFGLNYWSERVEYNDNGIPIGELGLQSDPPLPDVAIGIESPIGGVETTLPFATGGEPTTESFGPSLNIPLPPIAGNFQVKPRIAPEPGLECDVETPAGGVGGGISIPDLSVSGPDYSAPSWNFPLAPFVNGYISFRW